PKPPEITVIMAAQNLKPAKNTKPHHRGGTIRQIQPITYIIGIDKLGTLLSSQTTDTFEYSRNNSKKNFFSVFLRCDVFILFHSYSLLQIRLFSRNSLCGMNPPSKMGSILRSMHRMADNCFSISVGGLSPLSGGDSENNTRPSAAAQIGRRGACRW
ncbi:hypothetical protein, partial [Pseudarthrobacter sp. LMD1-1-1.1]|uniref:hypothetical protein n=1 Tax=Pseudarthrobacter sp. LMD1-1-1.1 TaxID=3135242 RepID=UPI0034329942